MFQIMIVDDEPSVLESLARTVDWSLLDIENVYLASSGQDALELLERHPVDIVITDIRMPEMTGLELIEHVRRRWTMTKFIILSGHAEFQYARQAMRTETTDYLLKPVRIEDLKETVRHVQDKLREDWERINSYRQALDAIREHRSLLQANTLSDLLQGRSVPSSELDRKLEVLDLPMRRGDRFTLLIVRPEEGDFARFEPEGPDLLFFTLGNMAEEIIGSHMKLWYGRDNFDYLAFLVKMPGPDDSVHPDRDEPAQNGRLLLERLAYQLQQSVHTYLKGNMTLGMSREGRFPDDVRTLYENMVFSIRQKIGSAGGYFFTVDEEEPEEKEVQALDTLYRPPSLLHLLEAGRWEAAGLKLEETFDELNAKFGNSREHLLEVYYAASSAFAYIAHKNGKLLSTVAGSGSLPVGETQHSVAGLREWSAGIIRLLREDMEKGIRHGRTSVLSRVQQYAETHLDDSLSLQSLADHVHLHPVYLSKMYKAETGESVSDYLSRLKLERAAYLLKSGVDKIYEIARQVGYEHTYFMKVFKKHFGITPQEYRDGAQSQS